MAKRAGFCFGVKRAIDIAFDLAKETNKGIYTLGPLIHNPQVVQKLTTEGVAPIDNVHSRRIKTLVIRTHGVSPKVYKEISEQGYKIVDATCPFVKKAQQHAQSLKEEGYQVVILGDKEHPEVQSLLGFAGDGVVIVNMDEPIPRLKQKVGIIVQTTQPFASLEKLVLHVLRTSREVKVYNTICDSTAQRLEETRELAKRVDTMIIVGGRNSANTTQLTNLSKNICAKVYHVETADEIQEEWFRGDKEIGITGGASTPQWIIDEVVKKIREISVRR